MKIAILGETSAIAKDMAQRLLTERHKLHLYNRNNINDFPLHDYDVVINFIGRGSPRRVAAMGREILDATESYDRMVLNYLDLHPDTKYIFFSSGAVYGNSFDSPVTETSVATLPLNSSKLDWYSVAKIMAECRHRASPHSIVDIRVFNYFSASQKLDDGFMMTEIVNCIKNSLKFYAARTPIVRDWISPEDLYQLLDIVINVPDINMAVDCYSEKCLSSIALLQTMAAKFGLEYEYSDVPVGKRNYYSLNKAAERLGYTPTKKSIDTLLETSVVFLDTAGRKV